MPKTRSIIEIILEIRRATGDGVQYGLGEAGHPLGLSEGGTRRTSRWRNRRGRCTGVGSAKAGRILPQGLELGRQFCGHLRFQLVERRQQDPAVLQVPGQQFAWELALDEAADGLRHHLLETHLGRGKEDVRVLGIDHCPIQIGADDVGPLALLGGLGGGGYEGAREREENVRSLVEQVLTRLARQRFVLPRVDEETGPQCQVAA